MPPCDQGDLPLRSAALFPARPAPLAFGRIRLTRMLVIGLALSCLVLQRFALPAGGKSIDLVGPVGFLLMGYGLLRGAVTINRPRLVAMTIMVLLVVAGLFEHAVFPSSYASSPDISSLLQFVLLSGFAVFGFTETLPEEAFFRLVTGALIFIAIAGLLQFALQTVGLGLFSFRGLVPAPLLFEDGYNLSIPLGYGGLLKSNGFFLLEPSIFSQFMALGLIIEVLTVRRAWVMILLIVALLSSASGTGWLVLGSFVLSAGFTMGRRGLVLAAIVLGSAGLILALVALVQPEFIGALADRLGEFTRQSTSANLRFVTPFWLLGDVVSREPQSLLFGLGAGITDRLTMAYEFTVNTPVKIVIEYGLPVLLAYIALFLAGRKTHIQRALTVPALVLLLLTGGYQQFPPILFFIFMVLSTARLEELK